jgi:competence CoiA-like predicted nuclease
VLEDTSTSKLGDKAFLQTILSMDQPKMALEVYLTDLGQTIHIYLQYGRIAGNKDASLPFQ